MKYDDFILYVIEHFKDYLPAAFYCSIKMEKVAKNNGILLDALAIKTDEELATPMIYLQHYYEILCQGVPLRDVMSRMNQYFIENYGNIPNDEKDYREFEHVKRDIYYRVVHYEMNKIMLRDIPHRKVLDLAYTYRLIVHEGEVGVASYGIKNEDLEQWDISIDEIHEIAAQNTKRLFPAVVKPIESFIGEYIGGKENHIGLYVITNDQHINGATCAFYEGVLQHFAKQKDSNIYILPASIHEMILLTTTTVVSTHYLYHMVEDANESITDNEDILSYCVYHYNKENQEITIVPN